MPKKSKKQMRRKKGGMDSDQLAYSGPIFNGSTRVELAPRVLTSNLTVVKVFRFMLGNSVAEGTVYNFSAAKLCALISIGQTSTTLAQLFERVQIKWIKAWSTTAQTSGLFVSKSITIQYSGTGNGIVGPDTMVSDTSVGATRNARLKYAPPKTCQASQPQDGGTTSPSRLFSIIAGGGCIVDICLNLTVTGNARSTTFSTTVTGPATVGQIYWLALDNNAGANLSTSDNWAPMPELLTVN
jgi:hypothetical protein